MASTVARSRWRWARAASPVIQREWPAAVAMRPSRLMAYLAITSGRPVRTCVAKPSISSAASAAPSPSVDRDAGRPEAGHPGAVDGGVGVERGDLDAGDAGGDDRVGAGRRPAVVAAGLERDVEFGPGGGRAGPRSAMISACAWPGGWVWPRPTTTPSRTTTAPTGGLGLLQPRARRASARASRIMGDGGALGIAHSLVSHTAGA